MADGLSGEHPGQQQRDDVGPGQLQHQAPAPLPAMEENQHPQGAQREEQVRALDQREEGQQRHDRRGARKLRRFQQEQSRQQDREHIGHVADGRGERERQREPEPAHARAALAVEKPEHQPGEAGSAGELSGITRPEQQAVVGGVGQDEAERAIHGHDLGAVLEMMRGEPGIRRVVRGIERRLQHAGQRRVEERRDQHPGGEPAQGAPGAARPRRRLSGGCSGHGVSRC